MLIRRTLVALKLSLAVLACQAQGGAINIFGGVGSAVAGDQLVVEAPNNGSLSFRGGNGAITTQAAPSITATATATGTATQTSRVITDVDLQYFIALASPNPADQSLVPVDFQGQWSLSAGGDGNASAAVRVFGTGGSTYQRNFGCAVTAGCQSNGGFFSGTIFVRPADMGSVILNAEAIAPAQPFATASASAFIDPYFFINPDFLAEHPGYSLSTLNVGNVPVAAVPEPSTWTLLIGGLAALARLGHRRSGNARVRVRRGGSRA